MRRGSELGVPQGGLRWGVKWGVEIGAKLAKLGGGAGEVNVATSSFLGG